MIIGRPSEVIERDECIFLREKEFRDNEWLIKEFEIFYRMLKNKEISLIAARYGASKSFGI